MARLYIAVVATLYIAVVATFAILEGPSVDSNRLLSRGSRWKRQTVRIIANESVPCEQLELTLTLENGGIPPRHIELNDDDKKRLMRMRGFDFHPSFMAPSEKEATDIADILQPTKLGGVSRSRQQMSAGSDDNRPLSRSEIIARLRTNRTNRRAAAASDAAAAPRNEDSDAPVEVQHLPFVLPEDIGINRTSALFANSDFVTTIDYCILRTTPMGTVDGAEYLRMCTACATTISTPSYIWPSILYGAVCNEDDNSCLYEGTVSHGKCIGTSIPVTLMRKSTTDCVLVLESGEKVISEDWLPFTHYLDIGCECAVAEQSGFR